MSNIFYKDITVINNLTGKELASNDVLFNIANASITVRFDNLDEDITLGDGSTVKFLQKFDSVILWDFGDGTTVLGKTATHNYKLPGIYTVTCTCFDADGVPYKNQAVTFTRTITVKELLNTKLSFTDNFLALVENGELKNIKAGNKVKVAEIHTTLGSYISKNIPIKLSAVNSAVFPDSKDISNSIYQHLIPQETFKDKDNNSVEAITPDYRDVYASFVYSDNEVSIVFYVIVDSLNDDMESFEPVKLSGINYSSTTKFVTSIEEIDAIEYFYAGKYAITSIWYQSDLAAEVTLSYILDTSYLPAKNFYAAQDSVNLVPIGVDFTVINNNLSEETKVIISHNGLANDTNISEARYVNILSPFIVQLSDGKNTFKDVQIKNISVESITPLTSALVEFYTTSYDNYGVKMGVIWPTTETIDVPTTITLSITATDSNENELTYTTSIDNITIIDLKSFEDNKSKYYLDPIQDYTVYSAKDIWNIHKTHAVFNDVPELDKFMLAILEPHRFLNSILAKAENFVDDFANINTCSIKSLISILDSLNLSTELYNNENFSSPASIGELIKIFSINHARLVGTTLKVPDEFETENGFAGKNRGDIIKLTDKVYYTEFGWPIIIAYDRFARTYTLINTSLITNCPDAIKYDENGPYFQIIDYYAAWGWNLSLGESEQIKYTLLGIDDNKTHALDVLTREKEYTRAREDIDKYYTFYRYISTNNTDRLDAYLKGETISPLVEDYKEWARTNGSMEKLLYKALIEGLDL